MGELRSSETLQNTPSVIARHLLRHTNLDVNSLTARSTPVPTTCPQKLKNKADPPGCAILSDAVSQGQQTLVARVNLLLNSLRIDLLRIPNPSLLGLWMPHSGWA